VKDKDIMDISSFLYIYYFEEMFYQRFQKKKFSAMRGVACGAKVEKPTPLVEYSLCPIIHDTMKFKIRPILLDVIASVGRSQATQP